MHILLAMNNYNDDYASDCIIEVSTNCDDLKSKAIELNNDTDRTKYYVVVDLNHHLNFNSMYDCAGIIPSFKQFCKYTGVDKLEPDVALNYYNNQFYKQKKLVTIK